MPDLQGYININTRIIPRGDISENWKTANPVLLKNEIGFETETGRAKIGDGVTAWNDLEYMYSNIDNSEIDSIVNLENTEEINS